LAERIIKEAISSSLYIYIQKPIAIYVEETMVSNVVYALRFTAKAYVFDGRYEEIFASDVHTRVKKAFHQHKIPTLAARLLVPNGDDDDE